jgi:hypothetical protein
MELVCVDVVDHRLYASRNPDTIHMISSLQAIASRICPWDEDAQETV